MPARKTRPQAPAKKRILLIESNALLRQGLTALIDMEPDLMVCAKASTHRGGLKMIASSRPDLLIVDLWLGNSDGLELLRDIGLGRPVLLLCQQEEIAFARRTLGPGVRGYVSQRKLDATVLTVIRRLLARMNPARRYAQSANTLRN